MTSGKYSCLLIALTVCMSAGGCEALGGNGSSVVVLVDYSATFAPYDMEDAEFLSQVQGAILTMVRRRSLTQPVKIVWAAFGTVGVDPTQPCGPPRVFRPHLTAVTTSKTDEINDVKQAEAWFEVCRKAIVATSQRTQDFTDISGALSFSAGAGQDVRNERVIVMFSDLREDVPSSHTLPHLDLKGTRILLAWRPGLDDAQDPNAVKLRALQWETRLLKAGAERVCTRQAMALTSADIAACIQGGQ